MIAGNTGEPHPLDGLRRLLGAIMQMALPQPAGAPAPIDPPIRPMRRIRRVRATDSVLGLSAVESSTSTGERAHAGPPDDVPPQDDPPGEQPDGEQPSDDGAATAADDHTTQLPEVGGIGDAHDSYGGHGAHGAGIEAEPSAGIEPDYVPPATSYLSASAAAEAENSAQAWALVAAAQNGDVDSYGQLYDRYVGIVFRFIHYRLGDKTQAEDLTSETFVRGLRRLQTLHNQGRDPAAWFITIARNLILDHVKSARYRLEIPTEDLLEPSERSRPGSETPETAVLTALTNERLLDAVRELSDEQRECIVLRFLHGMSVAETAQVMGKNDGAIKAMQHRAVRRLHAILKDELL